jgi:GNAT superfamily N-acetyltransferase
MISPDCIELRNITVDPDMCFEAGQLICSRLSVVEAHRTNPFTSGEDVIRRLASTLVLGAFEDNQLVGALFARQYGTSKIGIQIRAEAQSYYAANQKKYTSWYGPAEDQNTYGWSVNQPSNRQVFTGLYIQYLAVDSSSERQGVGQSLVRIATEFAANRGLDEITLIQTMQAAGFYDKLGFEAPRSRKSHKRRLLIES